MAAVLTLPENVNVGDEVEITGTGFQTTHAYTAVVSYRNGGFTAVFASATVAGAVAGQKLVADREGLLHVTVDDGTDSVYGTVNVWRTS